VSELPVPLAPIALLPVLPVAPAVLPLVLVLVSALGAALGAVLGVVLGAALGMVVDEPADPVAGPAAGAVVPEPLVPLPDVWAMDSPPMARAAAAARVVRVFLVVVIANSLNGNPEGNRLKKAGKSQLLKAYVSVQAVKSGYLEAQLVGPQLSRVASQYGS